MFILISGISCTYFPMNAPEHWYYLGEEENNHINVTSVARTLTSIFSKTHIWIIETINGFFYSHFLS
ncbi:MAG: hypothetical protein E7L01_26790, partial [Paenibacillus macerans]|uniref:hypothetical protein n=1 Tax=Paenibacillus macerans TaxID=44252 RepID=UPI002914F87D